VVKDLPSVQFEEDSPDMRYWVPHILPYIKSWDNGKTQQQVLGSVDELFSWYNDLIDDMEPSDPSKLKVIVDSIVIGSANDREKVERIFKWTQANIKYVAVENGLGGFIPRTGAAVCSKRYGDCKDMASIITEMTRLAGVETNLTWIGSRDIPYKYTELATPSVDNHMIAAYKDGDDWLFLDATGSYEYFGQPTAFIQGKEALIRISDSEYEIVEVPIAKAKENERTIKSETYLDDGVLKSKSSAVLTGYYASAMKGLLERLDADEKEEYLNLYFKQGNNKCKLENIEYTLSEEDRLIEFTFEMSLADYVLNVDDELIVNLNLDKPYSGYAVDEDRSQSRSFRFESLVAYETSFSIPEGYQLEFLPESSSGVSGGISYEISYQLEEDKVLYQASFELSTLMLKPEGFKEWNALIKGLKKELKNAIVLKKKKI
ncbi:MAG: transglutaminase-like domain-containing protein, partial [Flavobacteriales bacterium]